jgi:CBS domain-containing protein
MIQFKQGDRRFDGAPVNAERRNEMNLLFFLTPKAEVAYLYDDFTLRQALEKMEHHRYSSIPILNRKGEYVGTITEGDMLWAIKQHGNLSLQQAEDVPLLCIPRKRDYQCVSVDTTMEQLVAAAMTQNFVPVIDGKNSFIGLVKRNSIIQFCYDQFKNQNAL